MQTIFYCYKKHFILKVSIFIFIYTLILFNIFGSCSVFPCKILFLFNCVLLFSLFKTVLESSSSSLSLSIYSNRSSNSFHAIGTKVSDFLFFVFVYISLEDKNHALSISFWFFSV